MEYFDIRETFSENEKKSLSANKEELSKIDLIDREMAESYCERLFQRIPKEIGEMLLREKNNPDYVLLYHRTCEVSPQTVFQEGLLCRDGNEIFSTMDGYDSDVPEEWRVIGDTEFLDGIFRELPHKPKAERCLIMKIPKTALEYVPGESKPILLETDQIAMKDVGIQKNKRQTILLPEYVLGSLEFDENKDKKISEFVSNPNYKEIHNHRNDGLVCTSCLIQDYIKQNNIRDNDKTSKISRLKDWDKKEKLADSIICKENDRYMKRSTRSESDIKQYSKKGMLLSKFNQIAMKIKNFFTKDKIKEENSQDVDK